jgi:hypothetical protein
MEDTGEGRTFEETYLAGKLQEIDTALDRIDRFPEHEIDVEGRRRLLQLKLQIAAAVESLAPRETRRRIPVA